MAVAVSEIECEVWSALVLDTIPILVLNEAGGGGGAMRGDAKHYYCCDEKLISGSAQLSSAQLGTEKQI